MFKKVYVAIISFVLLSMSVFSISAAVDTPQNYADLKRIIVYPGIP